MKEHSFIKLLSISAAAFIFSCQCPDCPPASSSDDTTSTALTIHQTYSSAPLGNSEYEMLGKSALIAFSKELESNPGNFGPVDRREPKIALQEFVNYYKDDSHGSFEGIRIYPGLTDFGIVFIMCKANLDNDVEGEYHLLQNDIYDLGDLASSKIQKDMAKSLHQAYLDKVKIFFQSQKSPGTTLMNKIRNGRFYKNSIFDKYIQDNLPAPSHDIPDPMADTQIIFELGYILDEVVNKVQNRIQGEAYSNNDLQGFTLIMYLESKSSGASYVDRFGVYRTTEPDNYRGLYLEVGSPCPPRCGSLIQ